MNELLQSLLLNLDGIAEIAAQKQVYDEYLKLCNSAAWETHDHQRLVFHADRFQHAFFTSRSWATLPKDKSVFDRLRGSRVRWIEPLIAGRFEQSDCWEFPPAGGPKRRLYVLWPERFMVWLLAMANGLGWNYSTGYIAVNHGIIRGVTRGPGKKIWWHKKSP